MKDHKNNIMKKKYTQIAISEFLPNTHGGKREGSGRPKGKPTVTISFRVPVRHAKTIKNKVNKIIDQYDNNKNL